MADNQGNMNRPKTGTVPKVKYSNNSTAAIRSVNDRPRTVRMANNLAPSWYVHAEASPNFIYNTRRSQRSKYLSMDVAVDGSEVANGVTNYSVNGVTPTSSSSTSRRDSVTSMLKSDNITKFVDRKQIEAGLAQIRKYLDITSSLMTNIRNSDGQIFDIDEKTDLLQTRNDLLDSEHKLVNLLEDIDNNEKIESQVQQSFSNIENYSDHTGDLIKRTESDLNSFDNELTSLRDQQMSIFKLHQKYENRLADARHVQERMASSPICSNQLNLDPQKCNKNLSLAEFDTAIRELEERAKGINRSKPSEKPITDNLMAEMEHLQNQIMSMHDANNEREQLIEVLDNRDAELRSQQSELKKKLMELQNKKDQVDQLVMQLQIMDEDNQSDVGAQVRNIVTMKDQLKKLKDMLEIVNNTTEQASPAEVQAAANEICLTAENLQNEIAKPSHKRNDSYVENRLENRVSNEIQKELNKSQRKAKPRTSSVNEQAGMRSELEARKRELEEIMGKHKAATSNLNHDVRGNPINDMSWKPAIFSQDQTSEDRLSSEPDENEYSEVQDFGQPLNSFYPSGKSQSDIRSECELMSERMASVRRTPERNARLQSEYVRQPANNQNREKQQQLQKQLELIKSVCDSVLEQIPNNQQHGSSGGNNIQQVRNNITPVSSVYTEHAQRVSCPPSPATFRPLNHNHHQINVLNDPSACYNSGSGSNEAAAGYQNWLTTNNLQTQSFMLNTLNQCCQMLWVQQREMMQLRNTVSALQERLELPPYASALFHSPPSAQSNPTNHLRVPPNQKAAANPHVSAACSMPNLTQYNPVACNGTDLAFVSNNSNGNAVLLESCLNNSNLNLNHQPQQHQQQPPQMWLNNQVAPGNRANNYWDNFRSYSRQNQLSSKNCESSGVHNAPSSIERFHLERVNPFPLIPTSKSNSEHSSTNSRETTPRKRSFKMSRRNEETANFAGSPAPPPPDVLNINQNLRKPSEYSEQRSIISTDGLDKFLNCQQSSVVTNAAGVDERDRLWRPQSEPRPKKNKLMEELRENVYKEVASLISANEARPHFLIQLFRDLQKIESDSLRLKILQSVQNILTQSLVSTTCPGSRQMTESQSTLPESSERPNWSRPSNQFVSDVLNIRFEGDEPFLQNSYKEIMQILDVNEDNFLATPLLAAIKRVFLDSDLFKDSVKDIVFLRHFSNVLDELLEQYRGKKVLEVKADLIQTIGDLLQGELSFIHLIQETVPEHSELQTDSRDTNNATYGSTNALFDASNKGSSQSGNIQNGDLAEADQSRIDDENDLDEEEGAVGGIIESPEEESQAHSTETLSTSVIDFVTNVEGLDQVPTRLPTKVNSGSVTPTKDLISSHHDSESY